MSAIKLLVSELGSWKRYVSREYYHVMTDLMTNHGWRHIETAELFKGVGTVRGRLLGRLGELPRVILFWESYYCLYTHAPDVIRLDCRKCIFADDLKWFRYRSEWLKRVASYSMCDTILASYAYAFDRFYPHLAGRVRVAWVPHAASPDFMLDYNPRPANAILLSGALNQHYPLREQMMRLREGGRHAITYHPHPGYHCGYDYAADARVGQGYAARIRSHRAGFTDSTRYGYLVAKYFEIPATGALLLADDALGAELKELGLVADRHYVPVSPRDLEEKVRFVLDERNHPELDRVRKRGQELIRERHKTGDRARLIDRICAAS
ncbi:MAG TPA: glycosyltransferase [Pyrinomonadaceae bacterium]